MTSPDAATALRTFAEQFAGFHVATIICATVIGLFFSALGLYNFATLSQRMRQGDSGSTALIQCLVGATLLSVSVIMQIQTNTLIGNIEVRTPLDFMAATQGTSEEGKLLALVLLGIMTVFGWAAIIRGWVILAGIGQRQAGARGSEFWNACVFLFCGTVSANLVVFGDIIAASFGSENYLRTFLDS